MKAERLKALQRKVIIGPVVEVLAAEAHKAWSGWMSYMFAKCHRKKNGELVIPKWAVDRWDLQRGTVYEDLDEDEKESDRKEADRYIEAMGFDDLQAENAVLREAVQDLAWYADFDPQETPPTEEEWTRGRAAAALAKAIVEAKETTDE